MQNMYNSIHNRLIITMLIFKQQRCMNKKSALHALFFKKKAGK